MTRQKISTQLDQRIRQTAQNRCGYCLHPQRLLGDILQIEHIIPVSKGGSNNESNLWLACSRCNRHKSNNIFAVDPHTAEIERIFNPRQQVWREHFRWSTDGLRVVGLTPTGRATVALLRLDSDPITLNVRKNWVLAGWHPPSEL